MCVPSPINGATSLIWKNSKYIATKAKNDILVIWTDYFKPEHLEKYPDLHEKVWNACKLGSYVKVNVDLDKAKEFKSALEEIGNIFWETKK